MLLVCTRNLVCDQKDIELDTWQHKINNRRKQVVKMRDAKRPTNPCACCCIFTFPKANNCTAPNQVLVVKQLSRPHYTHVLRYNFTHRQSRLYIYLKDDRYVSISRPIVGVVEKWVQHSSLLFLLFRCRYRKLARLPPPFSTVLLLLLL